MSPVDVSVIGVLVGIIGTMMAALIRGNIVSRRVIDELLDYHRDRAEKAEARADVLASQNGELIASQKAWLGMVDDLRAAAQEARRGDS